MRWLLVLGWMALASGAPAAENAARELRVEAAGLVQAAERTESIDGKRRLLEEARGKLLEIQDRHPSQAAEIELFLDGRRTRISLERLGEMVDRLDEVDCISSPAAGCVEALARQSFLEIQGGPQRARALRDLARAQAEAGLSRESAATFAEALEAARGIKDAGRRADALKGMAMAQAEAGSFADALRTASAIGHESLRAEALSATAVAQAEAGDIGAALRTVEGLEDFFIQEAALQGIAAARAKAGDFGAALQIARRLSRGDSRHTALGEIAVARAEAGDFVAALQTAKEIDDTGRNARARTLVDIATQQARAGNVRDARETAGGINHLAGAWAFSGIAAAQAESGDFAAALQTAEGIEDGHTTEALARDTAFGEVAVALAEAGDFHAAFQTMNRIARYYAPRASAAARIAAAQARAGHEEDSARTLAFAVEDAKRMASVSSSEKREVPRILGEIIGLQVRAGKFHAALRTAREFDKPALDLRESLARAFSEVAVAQAKTGDFNAALETARELEERIPDNGWTHHGSVEAGVRVFRRVAELQADAGEFGAALLTAGQIDDEVGRAGAIARVAELRAEAGDLRAALEIADGIDRAEDRFRAFGVIANGLRQDMHEAEARRLLAAAAELAEAAGEAESDESRRELLGKARGKLLEMRERYPSSSVKVGSLSGGREITLSSESIGEMICHALPTAGCVLELALLAATGIDDASSRDSAWDEIVAAHVEMGDLDAAFLLAGRMDDGPYGRRFLALGNIAAAHVRLGDLGAAFRAVEGIDNPWGLATGLGAIAAAQTEAGDLPGALRTSERIEGWRPWVLADIAAAQAGLGDFGAALQTVEGIEDAARRDWALQGIADAQVRAGDFGAALQATERIGDEDARTYALTEISAAQVEMQVEAGDLSAALQAAEGANGWMRVLAFADIAAAQARTGDLAAALQTAERIDESERDEILGAIAAAQAESGEVPAAYRIAERIGDADERASSMADVAARAGDYGTALQSAQEVENVWMRGWVLADIVALQAESGDLAAALQTSGRIDDASLRSRALTGLAKAIAAGE